MKSLTTENFPMILAAATPENKIVGRLESILKVLNTAFEINSIPNPVFKDSKDDLNRITESMFFIRGIYYIEDRRLDEYSFWFTSAIYAKNRITLALKAQKKTGLDLSTFIAAAKEIQTLAEAFESLKSVVVKRAVRSAEEQAEDYVPEIPNTAEALRCNEILKLMTDHLKDQYADYLHNQFVTCVETFKPRTRGERMTGVPASFCETILMPLVGDNWDSKEGHYTTVKPDYKAILRSRAEADADFAQRMFLYKNIMKLAVIIAAKGLDGMQFGIIDGRINSAGFQGEIKFSFADGSSFIVRNKVVSKYSIHNRPFVQFPTTFHEAIKANGVEIKGVISEEVMHEVFAK